MFMPMLKQTDAVRWCILAGLCLAGCGQDREYGYESSLFLASGKRQVWAVAPVLNLSGQRQVDALLQADLLYSQVQQIEGITAIPVNRVAEAYARLGVMSVQSSSQAVEVCRMLGADAILVGTVTIFDPYNPPKFGVALQLLYRDEPADSGQKPADMAQVVGMFDAANGTVRQQLARYAAGRNDPTGALGEKEYLMDMDRYCGFVYYRLVGELLSSPKVRR
jgi:hypothetical protein